MAHRLQKIQSNRISSMKSDIINEATQNAKKSKILHIIYMY